MARKREQAAAVAEGTEIGATETQVQTAEPEAGTPATQPEEAAARRPYKPVRSWTERYVEPLRYEKLTDDRLKKILFRFKLPEGQDKPAGEALELMRSHKQSPEGQPTGLKFEDTRMHGKVWTIPNDAEGRELADRIDYELSKLAKKMEAAQATPG